jgi:hypothetical protein
MQHIVLLPQWIFCGLLQPERYSTYASTLSDKHIQNKKLDGSKSLKPKGIAVN